jgi:hypothetical protein
MNFTSYFSLLKLLDTNFISPKYLEIQRTICIEKHNCRSSRPTNMTPQDALLNVTVVTFGVKCLVGARDKLSLLVHTEWGFMSIKLQRKVGKFEQIKKLSFLCRCPFYLFTPEDRQHIKHSIDNFA